MIFPIPDPHDPRPMGDHPAPLYLPAGECVAAAEECFASAVSLGETLLRHHAAGNVVQAARTKQRFDDAIDRVLEFTS